MRLILFLLVGLGLCCCKANTRDSISLGFQIGSEELVWKKLQLDLRKKFKATDKMYNKAEGNFNRFRKHIYVDNDSVLAEYAINEPLQLGKLRDIRINLEGAGSTKLTMLGYSNNLSKSTIISIISSLRGTYGNPDNGNIGFAKENMVQWSKDGYKIIFTHDNFKPSSIDSVCSSAMITIQSNDYDNLFSEELKTFKTKYKPADILKIRLDDPKFEISDNSSVPSVTLVQLYNSFDYYFKGYDNNIKAIKFDLVYANRFNEDVLSIKDINYDFPGTIAVNTNINYKISKTNIGFSKILTIEETNAVRRYMDSSTNSLVPKILNLKILYVSGDLLESTIDVTK